MIKKYIKSIVDRFGVWRALQVMLGGLSMILLIAAIFQLLIPVHLEQTNSQTSNISEFINNETVSTLLGKEGKKAREAVAYRSGMFVPATGLQEKPLANKTIERIKGQLKLQCVMEMNGQPVAYINIQGVGLKRCSVGESVNDLFTVMNINEQNKSVEISIVDHKVTLHL